MKIDVYTKIAGIVTLLTQCEEPIEAPQEIRARDHICRDVGSYCVIHQDICQRMEARVTPGTPTQP